MSEKDIFLNGDRQTDSQGKAERVQDELQKQFENSFRVVSRVQK